MVCLQMGPHALVGPLGIYRLGHLQNTELVFDSLEPVVVVAMGMIVVVVMF